MQPLTPTEYRRLVNLMRECKALLRSLPKSDPYRCQIGRTLREAERRAAMVQCQQEKQERESAT
jgi:hypothetical protein